jgi:hypothetical protein
MSACKFCQGELVWVQKTGDIKPKPYNASDLTPHECEASKSAYAKKGGNGGSGYHATPKDSKSIENQVCMKEAAETWRQLNAAGLHDYEDAVKEIAAGYRVLRDAMREGAE